MADRIQSKILCPYFAYLKQGKICCEGVGDSVRSTALNFENNRKRNQYIDDFCACTCWQGCPIAAVIAEKYVNF